MLVVTMMTDEMVRIGENILVSVVEIRGKQIKLGIQAPDGVKILRGKVEMKAEGKC